MAASSASRTRRPKATTRSIILKHAYDMYLDGRLVPGDERLVLVLRELGYTTGAGYQIWTNQAAFRDELTEFIAENIEYASLRSAATEIVELNAQGLPFEEHVLAAGDRFIRGFLGREEFYLKLRFFAMSSERSDRVTQTLCDAYDRSSFEAAELFGVVLGRFGRRVRDPLTMRDVTAAVTAALEGYALRARVQPEAVSESIPQQCGTHHMFSVVLLAILKDFTEPVSP